MAIIIKCDVCEKNLFEGIKNPQKIPDRENITVKFETEQDEGRSCKPYLDNVEIHICKTCKERIVESGKYLLASGAQGYNNYYFEQ